MMKYDDGFHWVGLNYNNGSDLEMCRLNSIWSNFPDVHYLFDTHTL